MYNSYFNLPTYDIDSTYRVADIFLQHKNRKFSDLFISDNEDAWYYIIIPDNALLEQIAYQEYDNSSYWDLLFMINQMDTPFDLPKSADMVEYKVEEHLVEWKKRFPNFPDDLLEEKRAELQIEYTDVNEKHRKFRCVRTSHLTLLYKAINEL